MSIEAATATIAFMGPRRLLLDDDERLARKHFQRREEKGLRQSLF